MNADKQAEISFLIKAFARYATIAEATILFQEQFGKKPTPWQIGVTNLGRFINDRRDYFNPKENHRVRKFREERRKYEAEIDTIPMYSQMWRMTKYNELYKVVERKALETGNVTRCLDIMKLAAQDAGGAFQPKQQTINVDNRTVNIGAMSSEELDKRLKSLLGQLGVSLEGAALLGKSDTVIEADEG